MKTVAFVLALVALAAAGYGVYTGQVERARLEKKLEEKTAALDASVAGVAEMLEQVKHDVGNVSSEAHEEVPAGMLERIEALEEKAASLPPTGESSQEALLEGAQEMIRRIVREEQAEMIKDQEKERAAKKEEMQEKFAEMAKKHEEKLQKRLEEWVKEFSEEAGLTIAQEEGILSAYQWTQDQINEALRKGREEGGMVMFGPEEFKKFSEQRDEKIKDVLGARFADFEKYKSKNPLPETGYMFGLGAGGDVEGETIIIEAAPPPEEKKEKEEDK
jgi:hypothetical protein